MNSGMKNMGMMDFKGKQLEGEITTSWESPSNIAFIKYWGKLEGQIPMNPSLSMTLEKAVTRSKLTVKSSEGLKGLTAINHDAHHPFIPKLEKLNSWLFEQIPFLKEFSFELETTNTFPHSTGIASSASGISAYTLCMITIVEKMSGNDLPKEEKFRMASEISRVGSGSACRSLYGGFTVWGETYTIQGSSNQFAIPINEMIHPSLQHLQDSILVVSGKPKAVSSTLGHSFMTSHPFKEGRIKQVKEHFPLLLPALSTGDFELLANICETEALTLHGLIMTSQGNPILFEPGTIGIIKKVQQMRKAGIAIFFTLDAGANVHLIYPEAEKLNIENQVIPELIPYCENEMVIYDSCGNGPKEIS